jgi:O-antigen/teichoic acid export membrane protein
MKNALVGKYKSNPAFARIFEWSKLIALTGSTQALIQFIGLLSGIFVIRMLPTHEYGLYTLANTMLGTMAVLSDGGISTGVMSQGGKVWSDREELGRVLSTGFDLRKTFSLGSLVVSVPILFYLLNRHHSSLIMSILIITSIVPVFLSTLSGSLLQIGLTLNQDLHSLQKNQLLVSVFRFVLLLLGLFITPWAFVAILASAFPQLLGNFYLKKASFKYADFGLQPDIKIRNQILSTVKKLFPTSLYYCLSGQITIWLMSIFGSTTSVASLGALSRLSMVLNVFGTMFSLLVVPRFSRSNLDKERLLKRFIFIIFGLLCLIIIVISIVRLFPTEILWVLGKDYANLQEEVLLSVIGGCLGLMAGAAASLSSSRGLIIHPVASILISLLALIVGILYFNVTTMAGMLKLNIFLMSTEFMMFFLYGLRKLG